MQPYTPTRKPKNHEPLPSHMQYTDTDRKQVQNFFNLLSSIKEKTKQIRDAHPDVFEKFKASQRYAEYVELISKEFDLNVRYSIQKMQDEQSFVQTMFRKLENAIDESTKGLPTKRPKDTENPLDWQEQLDVTFRTIKATGMQRRIKFRQDLLELQGKRGRR
mmetsp:Transcript_3732/g.7982  ORF Transcript_3732/g.7982 Transcript_3732/m.7982 type:complete len:162 (+) Transcript_3732:525-1010(+)